MKRSAAFLFICTLLAAGCGTARRSVPTAGPLELASRNLTAGREVFLVNCHQCHPGGEAGLGPALNNKPLPGPLLRFQVRKGLGVMPAFTEEEISELELDLLVAYMKKLRQNKPE